MPGNEFLTHDILGHGAYLCARAAHGRDLHAAGMELVPALVERLQLRNEFDAAETTAGGTISFVRRHAAMPGDIEDEELLHAQLVIHASSTRPEVVDDFCGELSRRLAGAGAVSVLRGSIPARNYTGAAMSRWAYERAVVQQPGAAAPNAFLLPLRKIAEWWKKDWLERHTYFLPTYDRDVPVFHRVCAALRDVARNPEWRFVREGPTWHGRRVASWAALFEPDAAAGRLGG